MTLAMTRASYLHQYPGYLQPKQNQRHCHGHGHDHGCRSCAQAHEAQPLGPGARAGSGYHPALVNPGSGAPAAVKLRVVVGLLSQIG